MADIGIFDQKIFNPQVFGKYMETVPRTRRNELLRSGVLLPKNEYKTMFPEQSGGNYAVLPITGRIGGEPAKYDGENDMPVSGIGTFMRGIVVSGFMNSWEEKDFTQSITGKDFMQEIAAQVGDYWDDFDQQTIIAILTGAFNMTGGKNDEFVETHTTDITGEAGDKSKFNETTLNNAVQKASGDNKSVFTMAIMHSYVATNLENLNLIERLKYTDAQGIQRDLEMGTLNGRTVLIDDTMPVDENGNYTTYLLGKGAIDYADVGVKVPYEAWRDPNKKGGIDRLLTRQRSVFAPYGISFTQEAMATASPDLSEFELGVNWEVVQNNAKDEAIDVKAIPIARVISKG